MKWSLAIAVGGMGFGWIPQANGLELNESTLNTLKTLLQSSRLGTWGGLAGLIFAILGLLFLLLCSLRRTNQLELNQLQTLRAELNLAQEHLKQDLQQQVAALQERNDALKDRVLKLEVLVDLERQSRLRLQAYCQRRLDAFTLPRDRPST